MDSRITCVDDGTDNDLYNGVDLCDVVIPTNPTAEPTNEVNTNPTPEPTNGVNTNPTPEPIPTPEPTEEESCEADLCMTVCVGDSTCESGNCVTSPWSYEDMANADCGRYHTVVSNG